MKKLNNIILTELILSIGLMFVCLGTAYNSDEEMRIFSKNELGFALFLFIFYIVIHVTEYFLDKHHLTKTKIVKSVATFLEPVALYIGFSQNEDYANNIFLIISFVNIFACLLQYVIILYFANKRNSDSGESILPPMWFSMGSLYLYYLYLFTLPTGAFALTCFLKFANVWIRFLIFVMPMSIAAIVLSSFTNNKFTRLCYKFESELDYSDFSREARKLLQNKLNYETENYIKVMSAYYEIGVNYKKAYTDLINLTKESTIEKTNIVRDSALLYCYLFNGDTESFENKVKNIKENLKKERSSFKVLQMNEIIDKFVLEKKILIDKKADEKINDNFVISSDKNAYSNAFNAFFLSVYYYLTDDNENFSKYHEIISLSKGNLPSLFQKESEFIESLYEKEKSCGAVVYKKENSQIYILLEHMVQGHTSIPKGHVENDETEEETALREIKEETSLEVELDTGFRYQVSYSPRKKCIKDVVFFVAEAKSEELIPQEIEVSSLEWVKIEDAVGMLTYKTDKDTVRAAFKYLNDEEEY